MIQVPWSTTTQSTAGTYRKALPASVAGIPSHQRQGDGSRASQMSSATELGQGQGTYLDQETQKHS